MMVFQLDPRGLFDIALAFIFLIHGMPVLPVWSTASKQAGQRFSRTPYITPRLTPTGTPKIVSTTGSPIRYSAAVSRQETSRTTSPTKTQYEGRSALSSWYPSSQQSSAANSPPRGHPVPGWVVISNSVILLRALRMLDVTSCSFVILPLQPPINHS